MSDDYNPSKMTMAAISKILKKYGILFVGTTTHSHTGYIANGIIMLLPVTTKGKKKMKNKRYE